jgi:hypothetical protein
MNTNKSRGFVRFVTGPVAAAASAAQRWAWPPEPTQALRRRSR